jgi:hypothetical protein
VFISLLVWLFLLGPYCLTQYYNIKKDPESPTAGMKTFEWLLITMEFIITISYPLTFYKFHDELFGGGKKNHSVAL